MSDQIIARSSNAADNAVVFSYDASSNLLSVLFAIVAGKVVGKDD
jgi:hypothetical protein